VPSGSAAAAYFAARVATGSDIPTNGGCFRPVTLTLPEGSIVNPKSPAAVNARSATIKRICCNILGALRDAVPNRVGADAAGEMLAVMFGGLRKSGTPFVVGELIAGGSGAGPASDGVDVIETDATNCMNLPVEALERDAPIRVHRTGLREDSGGAGQFRGGLGIVREYEILEGEVTFTYRGERHYCSAAGAQGGGRGGMARAVIHRADGRAEEIPSKLVTQLRARDRIVIETAGGGGFGDPTLRAADLKRADIENGKVSADQAQKHYRAG
jgi:N-methylhydantoinase B